uniref:F-box/LRR-repeat protein n=1 Tax=Davidia involucrata TaxID=16924 RepID=A0A5B6YY14_DAVIN
MEGQKWEDLNMDCLVNEFGRVGMESLLLDVPFVCKSWYKAAVDPRCWEQLIFPNIDPDSWYDDDSLTSRLKYEYQVQGEFPVTAFTKFVVNRSCRSATKLVLPGFCTEEALFYVADECPALKILLLPNCLSDDIMLKFPSLISKWKNLEQLRLGSSINMQEILAQINLHCNNFVGLSDPKGEIGEDETLAIVTSLPNIKYLYLKRAYLAWENLVTILQGCKELVYFDVSDCIGFEEGDEEIIKLASHISTFKDEGSSYDDYDDYMETINFHDACLFDDEYCSD